MKFNTGLIFTDESSPNLPFFRFAGNLKFFSVSFNVLTAIEDFAILMNSLEDNGGHLKHYLRIII